MLNFKNVTMRDAGKLRKYYTACDYRLCEYSLGVKLMWSKWLHPAFAEACGCLLIRNQIDGVYHFDYPVPGPAGDVDAALTEIEQYCTNLGIRPVLSVVPKNEALDLMTRYPYVRMSNERAWRDYLYRQEDMANFAGRKYSGQRNHINKFKKSYPEAVFIPLHAEQRELIERFWADYEKVFEKTSEQARHELDYAKKMLCLIDRNWFCAGGLMYKDRLIALSLAEKCGDTLIIHIEKALYGYEGVYPTMVQSFAAYYGDGITVINREDDACDRGLRISKTQYHPAHMGAKYRLELGNELDNLREIPTLETPRLTLTALRSADKDAYNVLCLDDERNKWWGYDYREDLKGELTESYFLDVAHTDFQNKQAVNFAIRLDGKLIGEAVLYRFDWRGGAELGARIAPGYAGSGYGTEAFAAVADWALYRLHLERVVAKCFRENQASYRMLASCMTRAGEDDTYYYFEKLV
ncbi:MAG: GNAT family N-acetyltransferase [Clostridiales bacterium]|nr:GNAT family N-acetyltransferase [Clostridiales bacterium]